jgi:hypothetical protein
MSRVEMSEINNENKSLSANNPINDFGDSSTTTAGSNRKKWFHSSKQESQKALLEALNDEAEVQYPYQKVKNLQTIAKAELIDASKKLPGKEAVTNEDDKAVEAYKENLTKFIDKLNELEAKFKKTGKNERILTAIREQNKEKSRLRENPILGISKAVSYQENVKEDLKHVENLIFPYIFFFIGSLIVVSIAISMDFTHVAMLISRLRL